jgi:type IV pilus assembly protein PilB
MKEQGKKIGEILIEAGLIDKFQLASAMGKQKEGHGKLASILVQMGYVDEKTVASELEKQLGIECIAVEDIKIPDEVLHNVKADIAEKYCVLPIAFNQKELTLAMQDPTDLETVDELAFILGLKIRPVLALESSIKNALTKHYKEIAFRTSKLHSVDRMPIPEDMELIRDEKASFDQTYPHEKLIDALVEILIEKNVMTKHEISQKIRKKMRKP